MEGDQKPLRASRISLAGPRACGRTPPPRPQFGPAVGTWRSDLLCQKWSDPRNAATQDVGRV
eukprot:4947933-Prymnesium_polylepis.1